MLTPKGKQSFEMPPTCKGSVIHAGRHWALHLTQDLIENGVLDKNAPPASLDQTTTKWPWIGSPNAEEQARYELGQRRCIHDLTPPVSVSASNPWGSQTGGNTLEKPDDVP